MDFAKNQHPTLVCEAVSFHFTFSQNFSLPFTDFFNAHAIRPDWHACRDCYSPRELTFIYQSYQKAYLLFITSSRMAGKTTGP